MFRFLTVLFCIFATLTFRAEADEPSATRVYQKKLKSVRAPDLKTSTPVAKSRVRSVPLGVIVNGSFETNGGVGSSVFAGWTVALIPGSFSGTPGSGNVFVQTGTTSPLNGWVTPPPPEGSFAAMCEQTGPGSQVIYQDFIVPPGGAVLQFDLYTNNQNGIFVNAGTLDYDGVANQHLRVDIMNPTAPISDVGAGVWKNVLITNPGYPNPRGYSTHAANLSAFAGQNVRLRFAEVDNQLFFEAGIDNVYLISAAPGVPVAKPWSLIITAATLALVGLFVLRRTRFLQIGGTR